jgi:hypothetical protein
VRQKVIAASGALVVAVLVIMVVFVSRDENPAPVSLSVPEAGELSDITPSRPLTMLSLLPPAELYPTSQPTTTTSSSSSSASAPARIVVPPPAAPTPVPNASGRISYYSARTNEPSGSRAIAYPDVLHGQAGGRGTFGDPLTFAARERSFKLGTRIYVPDVKRYFVLEDLCSQCSSTGLNLWAGAANDSGVSDCTKSLTRSGDRPYVVDPPAGLPVDAGDLYQSGRCYRP